MPPRPPASTLWFLALIILGGALRFWSAIAFPLIDISDRAPLRIALAAGVIVGVVLVALWGAQPWLAGGGSPAVARLVVMLAGFALGASLGDGCYLAGNAFLDRAPVRWVPYTVDGHPRGRNGSRLALRTTGVTGYPIELWLPDRRGTYSLAAGTRVEVPIGPGAFGAPWLAGEVRTAP
jgi:hypothetical protein